MKFRSPYLYRVFLLVGISNFAIIGACQAPARSEKSNTVLTQATFLIHRRHPDRALRILEPTLLKKPDDTRALLLRDEANLMIGKRSLALQSLNKILANDPRNLKALILRSELHLANRNLPLAFADANSAIRIAPKNGNGYLARALAYRVSNRLKDAGVDCARAQQLSNADGNVFRESAICMKFTHLGAATKKTFDKAIELSPQDTRNYDAKAQFLLERKFFREAYDTTQAALKLDAEDGFALVNLSGILMSRRDYAKAIACANSAAEAIPWSGYPFAARGDVYAASLEDVMAIGEYSRAIKTDPSCSEFYLKRAISLIGRRDFDGGMRDLAKAYALEPENTYPLSIRADAFQAQGKWSEAERDLSMIISRQRLNSSALVRRGLVFLKLKQTEKAAFDFDRAVAISPTSTILEKRGEFYILMRSYEKALADFNAALKLDPKSLRAYRGMASAYDGLGKKDLASKALQASKGDFEGLLDQYNRASSSFSHLKNKLSK